MPIAHIILFKDASCSGPHTHVCVDQTNFKVQNNGLNHGWYLTDFNDVTSSFIILEGTWAFFADWHFESQMGPGGAVVLGPGVYNWIEDGGCLGPNTNDRLSSLKCTAL